MAKKLKVWCGRIDGRRMTVIAAESMAEASRALNSRGALKTVRD